MIEILDGEPSHRRGVPSSRVAFIAHGAGNSRDAALAAVEERPDFVEVDLWAHHGRLEARHERAAYPMPVWFEKWYLRYAPRDRYSLRSLVETLDSRAAVMLDLKNGAETTAALLAAVISDAPGVHIAASSQSWSLLRLTGDRCPGVDLYYSIDVLPKLDLFLSVIDRDARPRGVSCEHHLLTSDVIERLHAYGLRVFAWTVDDADRARELAAMGVDGITTHQVSSLRAALTLSE